MIRRFFWRGTAPKFALGTEAIVWAYRLFLDREPESPEVVAKMASELKTSSDIRRCFVSSAEYRERIGNTARLSLGGHEPPMQVEDVRDPKEVARLLEHIAKTWTRFGDTEPHFSVITNEKFKAERIEENREDFNASGKDSVDRMTASFARAGVTLRAAATCLEIGCGVGRVTAWLARRGGKVLATDISASHLALAREHMAAENIGNVEFHRLTGIETLDTLPPFDLFFSVIVLQHNPPPVIRTILERVFVRLRPGGIAYFQVPTYRAGYSFDLDAYLRDDYGKGEMEMHVLPQSTVLRVAAEHGLDLLEVIEDPYTGMRSGEVSNTFLMRKRDSA